MKPKVKIWSIHAHDRPYLPTSKLISEVIIWSNNPHSTTLSDPRGSASSRRPHIQYGIPENTKKLTCPHLKDINLKVKIWSNHEHANPYSHIQEPNSTQNMVQPNSLQNLVHTNSPHNMVQLSTLKDHLGSIFKMKIHKIQTN
jgi:hypothetical protein